MATNEIYQKIIKQIFKGNIGKQMALLRQKIEVMEFEKYCAENSITPNQTQQAFIDEFNIAYSKYESDILNFLGKEKLKDMQDPQQN